MNDLENKLRELGVLEKFIRNVDKELSDSSCSVGTAFIWAKTLDGYAFWCKIAVQCECNTISVKRVKELKKIYAKLPPRYKENL